MAGAKPAWRAALIALTACGTAWAADKGGPSGVQGQIEDAQGAPVSGALISVFGKGLGGGGFVAVSDDEGRFALPALPAGSYTLRALGLDRRPAFARQITVLPNTRSYFAVSLNTPQLASSTLAEGVEVAAEADDMPRREPDAVAVDAAERARDMRWRMRHRRRSVLEQRGLADSESTRRADLSPGAPDDPVDVGGQFDVIAAATALGEAAAASSWDMPTGFGLLRLDGRLADNISWSLGGLLAESENRAWRMAAEFVIEPGGGHEIEAGSGYGSGVLRPSVSDQGRDPGGERGAGVLFARDTFPLTRDLRASVGARWSYLGFLRASNYLDPSGSLVWRRGRHAVEASASVATLSPGGDLLTLSSLSTAPPITYASMDSGLRAERITRYTLAVTSGAGDLHVGARAFREGTRDQLVNLFDDQGGLSIVNARGVISTGVGLSLARRIGPGVNGSIEYALGLARRGDAPPAFSHPVEMRFFARDARFRDVVARLETLVDRSDTRVVAYYRVATVTPDDGTPYTTTRFDVQLNQGLPFMTELTRAEWELLVAFRNLLYEDAEGGRLDEAAVHNPPKRVVGGISVRF
jgi:hypothetical protein